MNLIVKYYQPQAESEQAAQNNYQLKLHVRSFNFNDFTC